MKTLQTTITTNFYKNCQISIGLDIVIGALSLLNGFFYVLVETTIENFSEVNILSFFYGNTTLMVLLKHSLICTILICYKID